MGKRYESWRQIGRRLIGSLAIPLVLPLASAWAEGALPEVQPPPAAHAPQAIANLDLCECLRLGMSQQPALDAYRASLAAAETNRRAVENIKVPTFIARELPYRREQATLGVTTASATLQQAEHDTRYAITRLYYSVIFARAQREVAARIVENLGTTRDYTKTILDKGASKEITQDTVDKITVYHGLAQTRQSEANRGIGRATAALREAIGIDPECCIRLVDDTLPSPKIKLCVDDVIRMALARRPEITLSLTNAEVTSLEVKAQGTKFFRPMSTTFAAVGDIHANPVPQGTADGEYRPGAVGPEMPTTLVGNRKYRMERARDFWARADAIIAKTRGLIALDAENTYHKWDEAANKVEHTRTAKETGRKLADNTRKGYTGGQKIKPEDVLTNEVLAAQAEAQYNEALYNLVIALADLERVTAGGFCANLCPPPVP